MRTRGMLIIVMSVFGCSAEPSHDTAVPSKSAAVGKNSAVLEASAVSARLDAMEKSMAAIVKAVSPNGAEIQEEKLAKMQPPKYSSEDELKIELTQQRLLAAERSLANISKALSNSKAKVGENCHWVQVCTYVTCCRWGPPGNGGTAVCLEPCCGAWEYQLKCD